MTGLMRLLKSIPEQPRAAFGLLAGYFLLHVLLRTLISDSLQNDEAEQALVTQVWLWGYGSQPPLYTWLQIGVFGLLGVNVLALALLKNVLLFSTYLFTYLTGREIFPEKRHALLAAISLLLIVLFAWESQRDQTHLVLATALAAATGFVAVRLFKTRTAVWYGLLGTLAALGVLAKYNYAVMIVSLLLAALTLPPLRTALFNARSLLLLGGFLVVIAPHAYWAWSHPDLMLSQSNRFEIPKSGDYFLASLVGAGLMLKRIVEFMILPLSVFGLLSFRAPKLAPATAEPLPVALLQRMMLIGLLLCVLTVVLLHVTMIRARWLQPLLISLPLVLVAWAQPRLDRQRTNFVFAFAGMVMLVVPLAMYGRVAASSGTKRITNLNIPYRALARQVKAAGFTNGLVLADGHLLGGNLRLWLPDCTITAAGNIRVPTAGSPQRPLLVAWRPENSPEIPAYLLEVARREFQIDTNQLRTQTVSAPALYAPHKSESLCFALFPASASNPPAAQGAAMQ